MLTAPAPSIVAPSSSVSVRPRDLQEMRTQLDAFLVRFLEKERIAAACHPAFASLYDDLKEFVCRPGKRLRPLLFLLAHRVFAGGEGVDGEWLMVDGTKQTAAASSRNHQPFTINSSDLLAIGASLEFLHAFILIHDDIIDRSETRRSLPTLHRVIEGRLTAFSDRRRAGKNLALVLGDILFALAQKCLLAEPAGIDPTLRLRLGSLLLGCMIETGFGEAADIVHGTRDVSKVGLGEIETMYLLKTTRYTIECPLAMAALLAGAGAAELDGEALARAVRAAGANAVVVTGGHRRRATDVLLHGDDVLEIPGVRHPDGAAHGSGCTHSSVLAARLAWGDSPLEAARIAKLRAAAAVRDG
ncbi:MAG: polyprenyl synthetase family protein, partial [Verrucomicrobia bacterium]|nr:polyprenyl synthetase family protein [Verrucomicrobiota bacterium]